VARLRLDDLLGAGGLVSSFTAWAHSRIPEVSASNAVIHLLDRTYPRALADKLASIARRARRSRPFACGPSRYGLSFYRNREVVSYEQSVAR